MAQKTETPLIKRILIIASGLAFLGSTLFALIGLFTNSPDTPQATVKTENTAVNQQQKDKEQGYLLVLKREPNNPTALQGLVETRLAMDNLKGTIEPLERLIKIYPDDKNLKVLLEAIKTQTSDPVKKPK